MRPTFTWYVAAITGLSICIIYLFTGERHLHIYFLGCLGVMIHERVDQIARHKESNRQDDPAGVPPASQS